MGSADQLREPMGVATGGRWTRHPQMVMASANPDDWPDHIKELKIPPGWKELLYNEDPDADLLAVGLDAKGRDQYVYSEAYSQGQTAIKFSRIHSLLENYDEFVGDNTANMSNESLRDKAELTALVLHTGIRPGSTKDTGAEVKAYGATTLLGSHVVESESGVSLEFTGKKGVQLSIPITDSSVAESLTSRAKTAGPNGQLYNTNSKDLASYVKTLGDGDYTTKDIRTALGTSVARNAVKNLPAPTSLASYKKSVAIVAKQVSTKLGNTPTVALKSYISPTVFAPWKIEAEVGIKAGPGVVE